MANEINSSLEMQTRAGSEKSEKRKLQNAKFMFDVRSKEYRHGQ
jgi:hypothetical protein